MACSQVTDLSTPNYIAAVRTLLNHLKTDLLESTPKNNVYYILLSIQLHSIEKTMRKYSDNQQHPLIMSLIADIKLEAQKSPHFQLQ